MQIAYTKTNSRQHTSVASFFTQVGNGPVNNTANIRFDYAFVDSFSGFKQPGWRQLIRNNEQATTQASGNKTDLTDTYCSGLESFTENGQKVTNSCSGNASALLNAESFLVPSGIVPPSEIDNRALIGFLKKAKATQRKLMALVTLGEGRQTINLIKKPALGLRSLIDDYVRSCRGLPNGISPRRALRHISSQWLEYSFGMRPLISDVASAIKSVEKLYFDLEVGYVTHTYKSVYGGSTDIRNTSIYSGQIPIRLYRRTTEEYGRKLCGGVRLKTSGGHGPVAVTLGLTLPDFVPSLYELIPWSFFVDYFTNVGEVLEALSFNQVDLVWHSDTRFKKVDSSMSIGPRRPQTFLGLPVTDYNVSSGTYSQRYSEFSRVALPLGLPSLATKLPDTWTKALNIGALASLRALR